MTVYVGEDKQKFVLDHVFGVNSTQMEVYETVGKETIEDVINGYNGTVLAYGQTGSGKTYSMFGPDIYDEAQKGLIPRMALEIFKVWDYNPEVKELGVSCSMLEIYKENLKDLFSEEAVELKIKESPQRGIYVEGLSEEPLGSEEELMYWIGVGEARRVWAETRQNAVSSRSHTLFMIEVKQTLANDSELRGILNLVDLAGCEKVGRSGAQGQTFEEGTKINLSLSALGNVIHALTSGLDHIPYRDSKLTRLLQESLGGNYKTTLIVACSPHSSQLAETLSTLKFAQRAKKIKNRVQVNVKSSPDQLLKIIEQLKDELREKTAQIERLTSPGAAGMGCGSSNSNSSVELRSATLSQLSLVPNKELCLPLAQIEEKDAKNENQEKSPQTATVKRNRSSSTLCVQDFSSIPVMKEDSIMHKRDETMIDYDLLESKLAEAEKNNQKLTAALAEMKTRVEILTKENGDLDLKLKQTEIKLIEERKRVLIVEDKLKKCEIELHSADYAKLKLATEERLEDVQTKVNISQIRALTEALDDAETECLKLLKEKKTRTKADSVEFCSLTLTDYVNKAVSGMMNRAVERGGRKVDRGPHQRGAEDRGLPYLPLQSSLAHWHNLDRCLRIRWMSR